MPPSDFMPRPEMMLRPNFNPWMFSSEFVFSIVVIVLCFIIYFKTKDAFNLTQHKGIGFFRKTFLFLALAYMFRYVLRLHFLTRIFDLALPPFYVQPITLLISSYFSTMAIFYLFLSLTWKRLKLKYMNWLAHIIALIIAISSFLTGEPLFVIVCQAILLIATAIFSLRLSKKSHKLSKLFTIYVMLFFFWILSLLPFTTRRILPMEVNYVTQIISFILFIMVFIKVSKWIK